MPEPLVSAVLPAFNAERYLGEAIRSVLEQDARPLEILVVDDGSADGTAAVAEGFGEAVRLLRCAHGGIGAARNRGVAAARGELVAFLDADDVWPPGRLRALRHAFQAEPAPDLVFGRTVEFRDSGVESPPCQAMLPGAALLRLDAFRRVGPFREDLRVGEFIDWMARARELGLREAVIDAVCLRRRIHASNTGRDTAARIDYTEVVRQALLRRRRQEHG